MSKIPVDELSAGMVVHINTTVLRALGGSFTTVKIVGGVDRAVTGSHYFLLLESDPASRLWTAAPLFSKSAAGSRKLVEAQKSGLDEKWRGIASYYSIWQMWKIPAASIEAASGEDETDHTNRRRYASAQDHLLVSIARDREQEREPYREVLASNSN